jgi:hypothetical protein
MTHWGPGAIPPGYMLAPDGTLVPLPPGAAPPYAQPPYAQPPYAQGYPPPAGAVPPGAVPYGYPAANAAPAYPQPAYPQPAYPQPVQHGAMTSVTVTVTTGGPAPAMPGPYPVPVHAVPVGAMLPPGGAPMAALPSGLPAPYAPAWSDPNHAARNPSVPPSDSSLALARDNDPQRERYNGDAGSFGALSIATSGLILATALATVTLFVVPVGAVLASAAVASGVTGGMGLWLLRQRRRARGKVDLDPEMQVRLLDLATQRGGRLTVTTTAQGLGLTLDEAEKALQAMARSHYVDVELEPEVGVVTYVFREMVSPPPAQLPANTAEARTR